MRPSYLLYGILFLLIFALFSTPTFNVKMFGLPVAFVNPFHFLGGLTLYGPINISNIVLVTAILVIVWGLVASDKRYNPPQVQG